MKCAVIKCNNEVFHKDAFCQKCIDNLDKMMSDDNTNILVLIEP